MAVEGDSLLRTELLDGRLIASLSGLVEELARQLSADVREVPSATGGGDAVASE